MESQLSQTSKKIVEPVVHVTTATTAAATASISEPTDDTKWESVDIWSCWSPSSVPPICTYTGSLEESVGSSPSPSTDNIFELLDDGDSYFHANSKKRPLDTYNFFSVKNCREESSNTIQPLTTDISSSSPAKTGEEEAAYDYDVDDEKHLPIKKRRRRFCQFNI